MPRDRSAAAKALDREVRSALLEAIETCTADERLALLTLIEHPRLLATVDELITQLSGGLQ